MAQVSAVLLYSDDYILSEEEGIALKKPSKCIKALKGECIAKYQLY